MLYLICAGKGTNELVDEHRGKIYSDDMDDSSLPTVPDNFVCISCDEESSDEEDESSNEAEAE